MKAWVNVNGQIADGDHAVVPVFDHGFLYGEGVYETMRTYNHAVFLFDRHMHRLRASAGLLHLPVPLEDAAVMSRIQETLGRLELPAGQEAYVRILLTRGVGDLTYDIAATPEPTVVIIAKPHAELPARIVEQGVKISLVSYIRNHPESVNPIIKSNNLLNNALAMQEAYRSGAYEALMRNHRGELAECAQANFFLVKGGTARTPRVESGLLEGVTRNFLFEVGREIGVPVENAVLFDQDLFEADEAFFTSTTKELVPVVQVDDRRIGSGKPGLVTRALHEGFRRKAHELTRAAAA